MPAASPWVSCAVAATELGLSRRTIHRRIAEAPHWREGRHYRWISKPSRTVVQIHIGNAQDLLRVHGW